MIEIQIAINPEIMSTEDLKKHLASQPFWPEAGLGIETRKSLIRVRGMDPTILVALIGAVGTSFAALLAGLLQIAQKSKEKKIIIQTKDGFRLEIPADTPLQDLDQLIEKLKKSDNQDIKIAIP